MPSVSVLAARIVLLICTTHFNDWHTLLVEIINAFLKSYLRKHSVNIATPELLGYLCTCSIDVLSTL